MTKMLEDLDHVRLGLSSMYEAKLFFTLGHKALNVCSTKSGKIYLFGVLGEELRDPGSTDAYGLSTLARELEAAGKKLRIEGHERLPLDVLTFALAQQITLLDSKREELLADDKLPDA